MPRDPASGPAGSCSSPPTTSATSPWSTGSGRCSRGGARVVSVSSRRAPARRIRWDDPSSSATATTSGWPTGSPRPPTCCSPSISTRSAQEHGVRAFSLHPGAILTPLRPAPAQRGHGRAGSLRRARQAVDARVQVPRAGRRHRRCGRPPRRCSTGLGGVYLEDCDVAPVANPEGRVTGRRGVFPHAMDPEQAGGCGPGRRSRPASTPSPPRAEAPATRVSRRAPERSHLNHRGHHERAPQPTVAPQAEEVQPRLRLPAKPAVTVTFCSTGPGGRRGRRRAAASRSARGPCAG